ncbi:TetR family transcriptional regulator C-terminal domain-containing protein [Ktedonobacter robiniae]|uniref:Tetracyclin repressor-like C-terminal domain-containing protein n=1 Tax=Ktedonobacter robiniae TaxID=2778365 RepID=A0ABQ3V8U7_9CHLR|nr:TetR family transcriptional regulator C-terminal domain-containing protein [Ktedonobacter robiniae]GHO60805.1 hypothetical protein KSB_92800 [Ktedonobacter robiniae]
MDVDTTRGCRLGRMTQEEVISQEALRHPISSSFRSTKQEISAALEQAQRAGALSETIDTTDVATTLVAIVQGG